MQVLPNRMEILTRAAEELADVLDAAQETIDRPDYWGSEWWEVCQGNRLLSKYVMVDFLGNVVHVVRTGVSFGEEHLTITYLPSWFAAVVGNVPARLMARMRSGGRYETINAQVSDRDLAVPLRIRLEVVQRTGTRLVLARPELGQEPPTALLPQISYDVRPSRGSMIIAAGADPDQLATMPPDEAKASVDRSHWIAPSLKIVAAPGVSIAPSELYPATNTDFDPWSMDFSSGIDALATTPFWGWFVMEAAREQDTAVRRNKYPPVSSQQALQLVIERVQNAEAVPRPGAARRPSGVSEVDFLLGSGAGPRFEEQTRPDGVDLLLLTTQAAFELGRAEIDPVGSIVSEMRKYAYGAVGAIPPNPPLTVCIRVDPQSAQDRFAYTVTALQDGKPAQFVDIAQKTGPFFRVSVVHTKDVRVFADWFYLDAGTEQVKSIVDFRERVVDFGQVPNAIVDNGDNLPSAALPRRALSYAELYDAVVTAIGFVPWPPCQVMSDLNDYATILEYLYSGKDPFGRAITGVDAAGALAGILLPQVLEAVGKKAVRLIAAWDRPGERIAETFAAVPAAELAATITPMLERKVR